MSCAFQLPNGDRCQRPQIAGQHFCVFHIGHDTPSGQAFPANPHFQAEFDKLVAARNGSWNGFVFPANLKWPDVIEFPLEARYARFDRLDLEKVAFKEAIDFSNSSFDGSVALRGVTFSSQTKFDRCRFGGSTDFLNVKFLEPATFHRAEFAGRTVLRANFAKGVNLNEAVFKDSVTFTGWRNVNLRVGAALTLGLAGHLSVSGAGTTSPPTTMQRIGIALRQFRVSVLQWFTAAKKRMGHIRTKIRDITRGWLRRFARSDRDTEDFRVFAGDSQLQSVIFMKPEQTVLADVDLSDVYFRGTNLRGVRFLGVSWWQPKLRRNGLRDELFIRLSGDGPFRFKNLPVLQDLCRNVRVALEENRDFEVASDFYVGELEARRARLGALGRHLFSIPAAYRAVSRYGTSVGTAFRMLLWYLLLHASVTTMLESESPSNDLFGAPWDALRRSIQVLIFQSTNFQWGNEPPAQFIADTLLRVIGVVQIAMLVLAFRSRIKRH